MRHIRNVAITSLSIGLIFAANIASAQEARALRKACPEDLAKYCKDTKPGGGRIVQCLSANSGALAPACKTALDALVAKAKERRGS